jgi:hypothetical protein
LGESFDCAKHPNSIISKTAKVKAFIVLKF